MPYVWMDEAERVQKISDKGISMYPEQDPNEAKLPNPGAVTDDKVLTADSGAWLAGEGGGSGGGVLVVKAEHGAFLSTVLDHTWQEIYDAVIAGSLVVISYDEEGVSENSYACYNYIISIVGGENSGYYLTSFGGLGQDGSATFESDTPDDYPVLQQTNSEPGVGTSS